MYDFVVVGVGPPGARFARRAAEAGYDVLALERGEVGRPLACSGHVSRDLWEYLPERARDDLLQNEIYGARFRLGGRDATAYRFYKREPVSNVIDRVGLDKRLASLARDAGADVREDHTVVDLDEGPDAVTLTVQTPSGPETVEAKLVVGADGPNSRVRRALGMPEPREFLQGVLGFDPEPDDGDYVDVHPTVPTFFAWRIPRGDAGVEYGLAAPRDYDVHDAFDEFVADYGATIGDRHAGAIPIGPPETVTSDRALLVGDAAGQTKPFTGGGILYGMRAADAAARTVDPDRPATLDDYERAWRDELGREITLGHLIRKGYAAPRPIQRAGLALFAGEIGVHMDEPSSLFSREQLVALFR
ncbi:MAG: geranylgeranyl reductase family protein [Halanaeroarchaeum sp.]